MYQLLNYYGKWHGFKGRFGKMPAWARFMVGIAALPGILLALLSIVALLVSLIALFLPANLMYRFVSWLTSLSRRNVSPLGLETDDDQPDFVAEQQGGGFDVADEDESGDNPTGDGSPDQPPPPQTVVEVMDAPGQFRPRRQIEVKIVDS